jgi:hypothetical protein
MVANKTSPESASVDAFLAGLESAARRRDAESLALIMAEVTGQQAVLWGTSIVGFGAHHYVYESGREGDTPAVSFAPRKNALVLYSVLAADIDGTLLAGLGPHTTGKGCLYIKELSNVDADILSRMIANAMSAQH